MLRQKIKNWEDRNDNLVLEMKEWQEGYWCRKNCKEWKESKFCEHLVNARTQYFKEKIHNQINFIMEVN